MGLSIDWEVGDDGGWSTGGRWETQKMGRSTPRISMCKSLRTRLFSHYQPIPWGYVTCIQNPRPRVRDWIPSVGWMKQEQAKVRMNRIRQEFHEVHSSKYASFYGVCVCECIVMCNSCDPMDFHGVSQARVLEWVAISFSGGSSWPRNQTCISCIGRWILY